MADEERSSGGSEIFRHEPRERDLEFTGGDDTLIDSVTEHIATHFDGIGEDAVVLHEVISELIHVDVLVVKPTDERPWQTLITSGMAERPMTVPEGLEDRRYAELLISLPPDWPPALDEFGVTDADDPSYWPIGVLKMLAHLPHEFETFLYYGHTIPNGDPPEPYAPNTDLCCAWIAPAVLVPEGFRELSLPDGRVVHFYAVVPIYEDEMKLKLDRGDDALIKAMDAHGGSELLQLDRPSVAPRRRGFLRR